IEMRHVADPYIRRKAIRHLDKKRVVIFAAGIGYTYFSTNTTATLRVVKVEHDGILMYSNNLDGLFNNSRVKNKEAKKYQELSYLDMLNEGLEVMDSTASTLCMDNDIPLIVFSITETGNIKRVVQGEKLGTTIRGK